MPDGLQLLFRIVNQREVLTGERKKFFPQYLKVSSDVFTRDLNKMHGRFKTGDKTVVNNIIKKREHQLHDEKTFEVISIKEDSPDLDSVVQEYVNGTDSLFYKKKRGTHFIKILLDGDTIIGVSEKLGPNHIENFKNWAKEKNLLMKFSSIGS